MIQEDPDSTSRPRCYALFAFHRADLPSFFICKEGQNLANKMFQ